VGARACVCMSVHAGGTAGQAAVVLPCAEHTGGPQGAAAPGARPARAVDGAVRV